MVSFQSTRPRGARPPRLDYQQTVHCFNPRAHVGRDQTHHQYQYRQLVSIHAPTWGATRISPILTLTTWFQSTRPRGARLISFSYFSSVRRFNPRAHVGRDAFAEAYNLDVLVSIHAPTWGATETQLTLAESDGVSIHAPTWGATFNLIPVVYPYQVSIHAPTWGAT